MNSTDHKSNRLIQTLAYLLFFTAGVFYLYRFTNYLFFYQEKNSLFLLTLSYLVEYLNQPGGFLKYLSELQTAFYFYPFVGAIIIMLELCGVIYLLQKIGTVLQGKTFYFIAFGLGATLFYLQINYIYTAVNNLGIFIQLVLFYWAIKSIDTRYEWIPILAFPFLYYLFGSFSLLFGLLFSSCLVQKKDWLKMFVMWGLGFVFFFAGKEFLFYETTNSLLQFPFTIASVGTQVGLFFAILAMLVIYPLLLLIRFKNPYKIRIGKVRLLPFSPYIIILVLALSSQALINKKYQHYFHSEKLFYQQKYEELVRFNAQFPSSNMLTVFLNNVALAEMGRLSGLFFNFKQTQNGQTLFLGWETVTEILKRGGHYYYAVGMINEAQRWAYEYMVMQGNTPEILKVLIKTDLIKGRYEMAEKYISVLEKSVFYRKDAQNFRKFLYNDAAVLADSELGKKRKLDIKNDFFVKAENPPVNLDLILESDSLNIPAIEYKLTWLMLQKDMQGVVDLLPLMEKAGYTQIPRNVEEVVVAYKLMKVGELPELTTLKMSGNAEQRFKRFYKMFQQNKNNKQAAQGILAEEFKGTYWYYVFFK